MKFPPSLDSRKILLIVVIFSFAVSAYSCYLSLMRPRVAVVRSLDIIYGYNGMKEARNAYKMQTDEWRANLDTLQIRYQNALAEYQSKFASYNNEQKKEQKIVLERMEQNMNKYAEVINNEASAEEQEKTQAVLNQINSYIQEYAKDHGYDFVLGADGTGAVLYGGKTFDITEQVLKELNEQYKIFPESNVKK